jgi:hypothetical protein
MLMPICFLEDNMDTTTIEEYLKDMQVAVEEVNRLLEIGRLLFSVLPPEEIAKHQKLFSIQIEIGNTGVP